MCSAAARSPILLCLNLIGLLCCRQQIGINGATHGGLFTAADATVLYSGASIAGSRLERAFALACVRREVGLVEETGKQDKVAEVHRNRQFDVHFGDVTAALAGRLQEAVGPNVDGTTDDHLGQLEGGDQHGDRTGRLEVQSTEGVVRVHHRVHAVVHHDEPTGRGGVLGVREPRIHQHRDVVIPVQEDQWLLPEHDEHRITQLGQLGQHEQPGPETAYTIMLDEAWNTHGMEETVMPQHVYQFWRCPAGTHYTEHC